LLKLDRSGEMPSAQTVSLLTHGGILVALVFLAAQGSTHTRTADITTMRAPLGHASGGGNNNPIPATRGFFAPRSPMQLAPPRLPDALEHRLAVEVTILDAQAPPKVAPVSSLGLPRMPTETSSGGPGRDGIGGGNHGGMGDEEGSGASEGEGGLGSYGRGISMPVCVACPYPVYTDEARHVKVQGTVILRVLVGADGRAGPIRVLKGVAYGLDRAVETVLDGNLLPRTTLHSVLSPFG
jgi:hypothetical protein